MLFFFTKTCGWSRGVDGICEKPKSQSLKLRKSTLLLRPYIFILILKILDFLLLVFKIIIFPSKCVNFLFFELPLEFLELVTFFFEIGKFMKKRMSLSYLHMEKYRLIQKSAIIVMIFLWLKNPFFLTYQGYSVRFVKSCNSL